MDITHVNQVFEAHSTLTVDMSEAETQPFVKTTIEEIPTKRWNAVNIQKVKTISQEFLFRVFFKYPWFLAGLTAYIIFVFVKYDESYFSYSCDKGMFHWSIITYQFNHLNNEHIIYNLIGLWSFGPYVTKYYTDFMTLIIYVIGVIVAGVSFYLKCYFTEANEQVVGASGGICSLAGAVMFFTVWTLVKGSEVIERSKALRDSVISYSASIGYVLSIIVLIVMDLYGLFIDKDTSTAHVAHLGGYLAGFVMASLITLLGHVMGA